jgi:hypothetical protein
MDVNNISTSNEISSQNPWKYATLALLGVIIIFTLGILFVFLKNKQDPNKQSSDQSGHQCTAEAKICPDGSSVSRTGSTCEFAPCPTSIVQNSAPSPILTPSSDNFAYGSIASTGDVDSKYTAEKNRYIGNLEMKPRSAITDSSPLNNPFVLKSKSLLQERGFTEGWLKDHAALVFFRENSLDGDLQQTPKRSRAIWQLAIGYSADDPGLKTIGYQEIISHLKGEITLDAAIEQWIYSEMHYAKRQVTFMKSNSDIEWTEV